MYNTDYPNVRLQTSCSATKCLNPAHWWKIENTFIAFFDQTLQMVLIKLLLDSCKCFLLPLLSTVQQWHFICVAFTKNVLRPPWLFTELWRGINKSLSLTLFLESVLSSLKDASVKALHSSQANTRSGNPRSGVKWEGVFRSCGEIRENYI